MAYNGNNRYDPAHNSQGNGQEYTNNTNRSPGTTRQGYGSMGNLNRQTSRQFTNYSTEQPQQQPQLSYLNSADHERFDPPQYDRMPSQPQHDYHYDSQTLNSQTWAYNSSNMNGGANTMGGGRMKAPSARRGNIPSVSNVSHAAARKTSSTNNSQNWMSDQQPMPPMPNINYQQYNQHMNSPYSQSYMQNDMQRSASPSEEDTIPTAIVIKNIPFAVKKESLIEVMVSHGLPLPYAFNYHFDSGVFRGLAFANYTTSDETKAVIATLNHLELQGRKLRVEYKKMLPAHERDRIERDKRERRGQLQEQHQPMAMSTYNGQLHTQGSMTSLNSGPTNTSPSPLSQRSAIKPPANGSNPRSCSQTALLT